MESLIIYLVLIIIAGYVWGFTLSQWCSFMYSSTEPLKIFWKLRRWGVLLYVPKDKREDFLNKELEIEGYSDFDQKVNGYNDLYHWVAGLNPSVQVWTCYLCFSVRIFSYVSLFLFTVLALNAQNPVDVLCSLITYLFAFSVFQKNL